MVAAKTRNEEVLHRLRTDILSGRLLPGQKLAFAVLTSRYGVSVGVLREALSRLAEQGLVVNAPQIGFSVTSISGEDLIDLTDARCRVEPMVLRMAIEQGDVIWESELIAAHHRLANTPIASADDPGRLSEEWAELHSQFHETLLLGCANARLRAIASQLRDSAELYRRWSLPLGSQGAPRDIAGEHHAIVEAAIGRNADEACALLVDHLTKTTRLLLDSGFVTAP